MADPVPLIFAAIGVAGILLARSRELALIAVVLAIPVDTELLVPVAGGLSVSKFFGALLFATLAYDVGVRGRRIRLFDETIDYVIVGFTGLVLLWIQARQRKSTWPLLGGGIVLVTALMIFFAH